MNGTSTVQFCTVECTPGRIRLRVRHEPALLPGALTPPRQGSRVLRGFAREIAARLNEARRESRERERICLSPRTSVPALLFGEK